MAANEFLIANTSNSDPNTWTRVEDLLDAVTNDITLRTLEWTFQPYARAVSLNNGHVRGLGFPIATWVFGGLRPEQRENLKDFVAALSADVYIRTPTNETSGGVRVWDDFQAILKWTPDIEIVELEAVREVVLTFTHLEEL